MLPSLLLLLLLGRGSGMAGRRSNSCDRVSAEPPSPSLDSMAAAASPALSTRAGSEE